MTGRTCGVRPIRCDRGGAATRLGDGTAKRPTGRRHMALRPGPGLGCVGRRPGRVRRGRAAPHLARRRRPGRAGPVRHRRRRAGLVRRPATARLRGPAGAGRPAAGPVRLVAADRRRRAGDGGRAGADGVRRRGDRRGRRPGAGRRRRRDDLHQRAAPGAAVVPGPAGAGGHPAHRPGRAARADPQRGTAGRPAGRPAAGPPAFVGDGRGRRVRGHPRAGRAARHPGAADRARARRSPLRQLGARPQARLAAPGHPARAVVALHHPVHRHGLRADVGLPVPDRRRGGLAGRRRARCSPCSC